MLELRRELRLELHGEWCLSSGLKSLMKLSALTLALRPGLIDIQLRRALARIKLELKHYREMEGNLRYRTLRETPVFLSEAP